MHFLTWTIQYHAIPQWDQQYDVASEITHDPHVSDVSDEESVRQDGEADVQDTQHVYTRSGRRVNKRNPWYYTDFEAHAAYIESSTPSVTHEVESNLLQPNVEAQTEPHPLAMVSYYVTSFLSVQSSKASTNAMLL